VPARSNREMAFLSRLSGRSSTRVATADRQSAFSEERAFPLSIIAQSVRTDLESRTRLRPSQVRVHIRAKLPLRHAICPARTIEASQNEQGFQPTPRIAVGDEGRDPRAKAAPPGRADTVERQLPKKLGETEADHVSKSGSSTKRIFLGDEGRCPPQIGQSRRRG
jgi:hypothetical protein